MVIFFTTIDKVGNEVDKGSLKSDWASLKKEMKDLYLEMYYDSEYLVHTPWILMHEFNTYEDIQEMKEQFGEDYMSIRYIMKKE